MISIIRVGQRLAMITMRTKQETTRDSFTDCGELQEKMSLVLNIPEIMSAGNLILR